MIPALVKGKLSLEQENLEDLLTSTVFGLLQYVPVKLGLSRLLARGTYFPQSPKRNFPHFDSVSKHDFWPWLKEIDCQGAEPDVLITLNDDSGLMHVILIEAKYRSGKSSFPDPTKPAPTDQLAREWDNLVSMCESRNAVPHLIYITADYGLPLDDLEVSAKEFREKRTDKAFRYPFDCLWLSWAHIEEAFSGTADPILLDLCTLSKKYGFGFFKGITPFSITRKFSWKFALYVRPYAFGPITTALPEWRFNRER